MSEIIAYPRLTKFRNRRPANYAQFDSDVKTAGEIVESIVETLRAFPIDHHSGLLAYLVTKLDSARHELQKASATTVPEAEDLFAVSRELRSLLPLFPYLQVDFERNEDSTDH